MKRTLTVAIVAFCGGVLVGYYLVPAGQHVATQMSGTHVTDWTERAPSIGSSVGGGSVGSPGGRGAADQAPGSRGTDRSPPGVGPGPGRSPGKPSLPRNAPGASRPLSWGQAPLLQEEYAQVLRDLGLPEEDVQERIASFTPPQPTSDDETGGHAFRHRSGPSLEELEEELRAALVAIGISPSDVSPMAERFVAHDLRPDAAEEKRLEDDLERALAELWIPPESMAPAPED